MASAGLLKVLHSGLQDERLLPPKGKPKISDFQKLFVKGGRFTTEWYRVDFDNAPAFGNTMRCTIPRRGHLITRAFLMVTLPDIRTPQLAARAAATAAGKQFAGPTFGWTNSIGHALVSQAQVTIGGTVIDTIDGQLMEVLDEFHTPLEKVTAVNRMLGRKDSGFTPHSNGWETANQEVAVPLPFWFSRGDPALALPIDAIGAEPVQIAVTLNAFQNLYVTTSRIDTTVPLNDNSGNITSGTVQGSVPNNVVDPITGTCVVPSAAPFLMPTITNSPFYVLDPSGSQVCGLNGNPKSCVLVSEITEITMPSTFKVQDAYLLLEYVYIDRPEANRLRIGDLSYPIVQHYKINPFDSRGLTNARVSMRIPNLTRELYFFVHRKDADLLNAPFLATRDLSGLYIADASGVGPVAPWWPDARGLGTDVFTTLIPAYSTIDSEPIASMALIYEGRFIRYASDTPALFRSIIPSMEQRKTPWHNKYYYHIPFGTNHEEFGVSNPMGHANLDKVQKVELALEFQPPRGANRSTTMPDYTILIWAETYNVLRVYGGRAGLLFGY
jgi:hypothetical protein